MRLRLPRRFSRYIAFRLAGYRVSLTLYATQGEGRTYECPVAGCEWGTGITDYLYETDAAEAAAYEARVAYHAAEHAAS